MVVRLSCARWQNRGNTGKPSQWAAKKSAGHGGERVEPQVLGDKITANFLLKAHCALGVRLISMGQLIGPDYNSVRLVLRLFLVN